MKQLLLLALLFITIASFAQPYGNQFFPNDPLAAEIYNDYFHDHDKKNKPMKVFYQKWKKKYPVMSIEEDPSYYKKHFKLKAEENNNRYDYALVPFDYFNYVRFGIESEEHIKVFGSSSVNGFLDILEEKSKKLNFTFWIQSANPINRTIFIRGEAFGNRVGYMSFVFLKLKCVDNKITEISNLSIQESLYDQLKEEREQTSWSTKAASWRYLEGKDLENQEELKTEVAKLTNIITPTPQEESKETPLAALSMYHIYEKGVVLKENMKGRQGVHLVHYGNFLYEGTLANGLPSGKGRLLVFDKKIEEVWYTFKNYEELYQDEIKATYEGLFFAGKAYGSGRLKLLEDGSFVVHSSLFAPLGELSPGGFLKFAQGTDLTTFRFKAQAPITIYFDEEGFVKPKYELQFTDATLRTATGTYDDGDKYKMLGLRIEEGEWKTCTGRDNYKNGKEGEPQRLWITWRAPSPCSCNSLGAMIGKNIEKIVYDLDTGKPKVKRVGDLTTLEQGDWVVTGKQQKYNYENDRWVSAGASTYAIAPALDKEGEEYVYVTDGEPKYDYVKSLAYYQQQTQSLKEQGSEASIKSEHRDLFRDKYGYDSGNTYGKQVATSIQYNGALRDYKEGQLWGGIYSLIFTNLGKAKSIRLKVSDSDGRSLGSEIIELPQGVRNKVFTIDLVEENIRYDFEKVNNGGSSNFDDVYVLTGYKRVYHRNASADIARAAQRERARNAETRVETPKVKKKGWLQEEIERSATFKVLVIKNDSFSECRVQYIATGGRAVYGGGIGATIPANGKVEVSFTASTTNVKLDTDCIGVKAFWK